MPQSQPSSQLHARWEREGSAWLTALIRGGSGTAAPRRPRQCSRLGLPIHWLAFLPRLLPTVQGAFKPCRPQIKTSAPAAAAPSLTHLQASFGLASLEQGSHRCPAGLGQHAQELLQSQRSPQSQLPVLHLGQAQCFPIG